MAKPILAQPPVLTNQNIIPLIDGPQADPLGGYEIVINGEATLWADTEAEAWAAEQGMSWRNGAWGEYKPITVGS